MKGFDSSWLSERERVQSLKKMKSEPIKTIEQSVRAVKASYRIVILGQIAGGKNNIVITRTGHRFPKPAWAKWRDNAVESVKSQLLQPWTPISEPANIRLEYWAGDKRRRDMPAIIDSIFHVLEKSGVVTDDWHLWVAGSHRGYDKENPRAVITFL